jgi:hypothetical protein
VLEKAWLAIHPTQQAGTDHLVQCPINGSQTNRKFASPDIVEELIDMEASMPLKDALHQVALLNG